MDVRSLNQKVKQIPADPLQVNYLPYEMLSWWVFSNQTLVDPLEWTQIPIGMGPLIVFSNQTLVEALQMNFIAWAMRSYKHISYLSLLTPSDPNRERYTP